MNSYQDHDAAAYNGLISTRPNGPAYMGVDHVTGLQVSGIGRKSVRITTKKYWTHGLFISDIAHMPGGVCGTWPAREWCPLQMLNFNEKLTEFQFGCWGHIGLLVAKSMSLRGSILKTRT